MKISDYLPDIYVNNREMSNIINSEENELENGLKLDIENSFKDTFAKVATEVGISKFEKILNIESDTTTETLDFRRKRVLNRLISQAPFTETYFINRMNEMLGEGNWNYTLNYNTYTLTINSMKPGNAWYREVLDFLDKTIPCNISYEVIIFAASWEQVYENFNTWQDVYDSNMTWQEVMDGEWTN